jgi:hypothetical protein
MLNLSDGAVRERGSSQVIAVEKQQINLLGSDYTSDD